MTKSRTSIATGIALLLALLPATAGAWGGAMHAAVDYQARGRAIAAGRDWAGLDLQAYLAGSPGPDIWYAAGQAEVEIPAGIEEDWDYVRLLFAHSRNVRQLSFCLGYAGHIEGDVAGHVIYLSPNGDDGHHLIRDSAAGFTLFGAYEGYPHIAVPLDLVVGWGLGTDYGQGQEPGAWRWTAFDEEMVDLLVRAAADWCQQHPVAGCPATADTVRALRDTMIAAVDSAAAILTYPGCYAEHSLAATFARTVRSADDDEFGPGQGPALLAEAFEASVADTEERLFESADIVAWIEAAEAPSEDIDRFFAGPPPEGQWEREHPDDDPQPDPGPGGCASAPPGGGLPALLAMGWLLLGRRRRSRGQKARE